MEISSERNVVCKFLMLYSLLEWMDVDYQLNYECVTTSYIGEKIDEHASFGTHVDMILI